jgi:formate dehydrogenase major subunit
LIPVIDFLGSEGLESEIIYDGTNFCRVHPQEGLINNGELMPPYLEQCIPYLNDKERITHPMKKTENGFVEISFSEAFDIIEAAMRRVQPNENAFFAGARLSNEAMYLIQKLARAGVKSNNIGSFHYFGRDASYYNIDKNDNVQFSEIENCTSIVLLGTALKKSSGLVWQTIQNMQKEDQIPVLTISTDNYYYFVKALNYYIVANNLQQGIFVEALGVPLQQYKERLLSEDFEYLLEKAGVSVSKVSDFVRFYMQDKQCVIVYSEQEVSSHTARELLNLCLLTGKTGFPSSGILSLKEKNNAQGVFDMGIATDFGVGGMRFTEPFIELLKDTWKVTHVATEQIDNEEYIYSGKSKNLFIFGEDPLGCVKEESQKNLFDKAQFIMVQDYFLTETAQKADIVLPDTFPFETGGSFTNTIKIVQSFFKILPSPVALDHLQQLSALCQRFGLSSCDTLDEIFMELVSFFKSECSGGTRHQFVYTEKDSNQPLFFAGCDDLMKKTFF